MPPDAWTCHKLNESAWRCVAETNPPAETPVLAFQMVLAIVAGAAVSIYLYDKGR